jgi:archaeosortase B (VPXXXP-CTERM-specific)
MSTTDPPTDPTSKLRALWANPRVRYPVLVLAYLLGIGSLFNAFLTDLRGPLAALEEFTALSVHRSMGVFTALTTQRDNFVTLDGATVEIVIECVGLLEMLIYSACVLAFPTSLRARLWGIPLGCLAIYGFNVLRIATLLIVMRHWGDYMDFFHVYFWQATLMAMIVSVLYGWIRLFVLR